LTVLASDDKPHIESDRWYSTYN